MVGNPFPVAPEGENEYTLVRTVLQGLVRPATTPGFASRLIALMTLLALAMVANILLLVVVGVDQRRRKGSAPSDRCLVWIVKTVQREGGSYMTTNVKVALPAAAALILCIMLAYVAEVYRGFIIKDDGALARLGGWRASQCLLFVSSLWIAAWGGLQSYLLSTPHKTHVLSPKVTNFLYLGGGATISCILLAGTITSGIVYEKGFNSFYNAIELTRKYEVTWQPGADVQPTLDNLYASVISPHLFFRFTGFSFYILVAVCTTIINSVNVGSLALVFLVRRQISSKIHSLSDGLPQVPGESGSVSGIEERHLGSDSSGRPSRQELRQMAHAIQSEKSEGARQIVSLQRAERDLTILSVTIGFFSVSGTAYAVLQAVMYWKDMYFSASWSLLEFVWTGVHWQFGAISLVFAILLLNNTIANLAPYSSSETTMITTGGLKSIHFLGPEMSTLRQTLSPGVTVTVDCEVIVELDSTPEEVEDGSEKEEKAEGDPISAKEYSRW
ncbi:hypothetical protein T439DRAFT_324874 [Meredithblackwellia eburnea MCA 4105]